MDNQTQSVAAPTAAPMTDAYLAAAPAHRIDTGSTGRLMAGPAVAATVHATGQVSVANVNAVFIKVWAPPPRRVSL